ncbi:hypothetical protein R6Q57_020338 [Mikania cordata]
MECTSDGYSEPMGWTSDSPTASRSYLSMANQTFCFIFFFVLGIQCPCNFYLFHLSEALNVDELENLLDDFMLSLNTEIEDGSIEEMADNLMILHEECFKGNFASIGRLKNNQVVNDGEDDWEMEGNLPTDDADVSSKANRGCWL